jgi:hypothetical protein
MKEIAKGVNPESWGAFSKITDKVSTDFVSNFVNDLAAKFNMEFEERIKEAISNAGFPCDDDFIKNNLVLITSESEKYIHIYYKFGHPEQRRIFSYEKDSSISWIKKENNSFTTEISKKYY